MRVELWMDFDVMRFDQVVEDWYIHSGLSRDFSDYTYQGAVFNNRRQID